MAAYGRRTALQPGEEALFSRLEDAIRGKDVLDVGVGAGRTAEHLAPLAGRYVGVDYSEGMLEECRRRHPDLDLRHCDARDLGVFAGASFDFVLFSFNGIDDLDHEGRLKVLAEVHRVLRPGGVFAFSAHNLETARRSAFSLRGLDPGHLGKYAAGVFNHLRMKRHEIRGDGWAVLNDQSYNFRLLTYYVTPERQTAQLLAAGFTGVEATGERRADAWLYYVARKP